MSFASSSSQSFNTDLLQRVEVLEEQIQRRSIIVPIQDLAPSTVDVIQPMLAVVREEDGAFVASFVDANMNASGETQLDAVEMLKDVIASSFRLFVAKEAVLGEEPKRQLVPHPVGQFRGFSHAGGNSLHCASSQPSCENARREPDAALAVLRHFCGWRRSEAPWTNCLISAKMIGSPCAGRLMSHR